MPTEPAPTRPRWGRRIALGLLALFALLFLLIAWYVVALLRMTPGEPGPYIEEARDRLAEAWADQASKPNR